MLTCLIWGGSIAVYLLVAVGTYVLSYAPFYQARMVDHERYQCPDGCPCREVKRRSFREFSGRYQGLPPTEDECREYEKYRKLRDEFDMEERERWNAKRQKLRQYWSRNYAMHCASERAVFWPFGLVYVSLRFVFTTLGDGLVLVGHGLRRLMFNPVQRLAERPITLAQRREAIKAENVAILARLDHDLKENS